MTNNLELNAIAYTFSKIDSNLNFNNSFSDRELLASVSLVFPEANEKTEKITLSLLWEDSTLLQWYTGTQKCVGRAKEKNQIDSEARLFWKSIVKTKYQSLTSLGSFDSSRAPDQVVHHICIRCIAGWKAGSTVAYCE